MDTYRARGAFTLPFLPYSGMMPSMRLTILTTREKGFVNSTYSLTFRRC